MPNTAMGIQEKIETSSTRLFGDELVAKLGLWTLIKEDYVAHRSKFFAPGFQALVAYRLCTWRRRFKNPLLRFMCGFPGRIGLLLSRNLYGIELYESTKIGRRLVIAHQHGIVLHQFATIGNDCIVRHGVTIGVSNFWEEGVGPVIGNRVHFGVGSVIVGNVTIGDNVNIGPNCVVSTNIPPNATVFAPQSRIIPRPGLS